MNVICTKRLRLRSLRAGDAEPIFGLFNNWNVVQWLSSPPWPYTLEHARSWAAQNDETNIGDAVFHYVIKLGDALIGVIGWRMQMAAPSREAGPHIGYWLGEPYWGQGFMTEALGGVVHHLFASRPGSAIYSGVFAGNIASLRVQEKIGFVREGEKLMHSRPRGAELAHIDTILTRSRYQTLSNS